ncbi:MAG: glucokinase [Thermodesulfobacteriota bacterium]
MKNTNVLAGDIGGTKTNLAVYNGHIGLDAPIAEATYPSRDYPSLEALVQEFLTKFEGEIHRASFGVAGPVANGQATITNLPWVMDEEELAHKLGLNSVHLLNDLLAFAHAVPFLEDKDVHVLNRGKPAAEGAKAVVAPGTGLGEAYMIWDGKGYRALPSEGGHADFAPRTRLEAGLLQHLWERFGHVSYERVCSGTGLGTIYTYIKQSGSVREKGWLADELARTDDPAPVIVRGALDDTDPCEICRKTLHVFISVLGAEAGNMALRLLATGGVYLGGGIPPRIISALGQGSFMQAFQSKGRMSGILEDIPAYVIVNPKVALLGAACHGLNTRRPQPGHTT